MSSPYRHSKLDLRPNECHTRQTSYTILLLYFHIWYGRWGKRHVYLILLIVPKSNSPAPNRWWRVSKAFPVTTIYLLTYSLIENLFKWHFSYLFQVSVHDTSYTTNNQVESALCNSSIHTTTVIARVGPKLKEEVWNILLCQGCCLLLTPTSNHNLLRLTTVVMIILTTRDIVHQSYQHNAETTRCINNLERILHVLRNLIFTNVCSWREWRKLPKLGWILTASSLFLDFDKARKKRWCCRVDELFDH